ncbi:MAG: DUF993 family protein [Planctomycetota bacterium]
MSRVTVTSPAGRSFLIDDERLAPHRDSATSKPAPLRLTYAAARVVMQEDYRKLAHSESRAGDAAEILESIDWEATLAQRRRLDALGFGIAEAMDTAQRFSLGWPAAVELIRRTGALGPKQGFIAGAAADHLPELRSRSELIDAVAHQAGIIQEHGGTVLLLPMPWLCEHEASEAEYVEVYRAILEQLEGPLFLHWLGEGFLGRLRGYFPGESFRRILALDPQKLRGAKLSLLEPAFEAGLRREMLEREQILLSGDDLHFAALLLGGDPASPELAPALAQTMLGGRKIPLGDFSHALLGILDGIAEPAALALDFLSRGDAARFLELMRPLEALGRQVFAPPTRHYKAGLAFLAWLNGLQDNFMLVNHEEESRDVGYYSRTAELAAAAGALTDAELARERLETYWSQKP